jgi:hypothetical protein
MPGIGELIDGAMQQAPHCGRHSIPAFSSGHPAHSSPVHALPERRDRTAVSMQHRTNQDPSGQSPGNGRSRSIIFIAACKKYI